MNLPLVDLRLPEQEAARVVREAGTRFGFLYVAHHGIPRALLDNVFHQNRLFFQLPMAQKMQILQDKNNRGYTPPYEEKLDPQRQRYGLGDTKEGLYFGREVRAEDPEASKPLHGPNQWPDASLLPDYRATMEMYFQHVHALGNKLIRLLALALHLPANYFEPYFRQPMLFLRPLHYLNGHQASSPSEGRFGAGAHTDYGMITILAIDGKPGLEVNLSGTEEGWQSVAHVPDTLVVNLGDMLQCWSNGVFRSTLHRVLLPPKQNADEPDRYSLPFFMEPSFDALVECLPTCQSPENPPKHAPISAGNYLLGKYRQTHEGFHE